jgi:hypothetical protein
MDFLKRDTFKNRPVGKFRGIDLHPAIKIRPLKTNSAPFGK